MSGHSPHWPARDGELTALWAEGHSAAEIGRRMKITKSSVIGRAHRIKLPARGSPIVAAGDWHNEFRAMWSGGRSIKEIARRFGISEDNATSRRRNLNLPARDVHNRSGVVKIASGLRPRGTGAIAGPTLTPRPAPEPVRHVAPIPRYAGRVTECAWPIGHPRTPGFHQCCAPSRPGKPYCEAHCGVAYIKPADRHADAA